MRPEELTLGDYVTFKDSLEDDTILKIKIIALNKNEAIVQIDGDDACDTIAIDDEIVGIPLTPEILEKNGFYYDEDRKAYLMGVVFQVKPERYGLFSFEICGCPYPLNTVSQLQHALRLCGIEKEITI